MENELQRVWRTVSDNANHNGYFGWEVHECIGDRTEFVPSLLKNFIKCRDDSYIMIQCYHFWTLESVGTFYHDDSFSPYQVVIRISN